MTHYETLGVERSATLEEIRTAYRRRLRQAHPDRGGSQEEAQRINTAYEAIGTAEARVVYDRRLDMQARGINVDGPHMAQPRQSTGTGTIPPEMWDLLAEVLMAQARAQAEARARAGAGGAASGPGASRSAGGVFTDPGFAGAGRPGGPRIVFGGGPFGPGGFGPGGQGGFGPGTFGPDVFREPRRLSMREVWLGGSSATRLRAAMFILSIVTLGVLPVITTVSTSSSVLPVVFLALMAWVAVTGSHRTVNGGLPSARSMLFLLYLGLSGLFGIIGLLFGQYNGALWVGFANLALLAVAAQTYVSFTFSRMREVLRERLAGDDA